MVLATAMPMVSLREHCDQERRNDFFELHSSFILSITLVQPSEVANSNTFAIAVGIGIVLA